MLLTGASATSSGLQMAEWLIMTLLGSLFPDIDTKSKGQKLFAYGVCGATLLAWYYGNLYLLGYLLVGLLVPLLCNHRGMFHKLWFIVLVVGGAAWWLISAYPSSTERITMDAAFFFLGAFSHLLLDVGPVRMFRW